MEFKKNVERVFKYLSMNPDAKVSEIASGLSISVDTVRRHKKNLDQLFCGNIPCGVFAVTMAKKIEEFI